MLVSLCYALLPWSLELVVLCVRSQEFKELEIVLQARARDPSPHTAPPSVNRR